MTEDVDIVFLLTAYRNMPEVDTFIDHVREVVTDCKVAFAICDNSPISGASRHAEDRDVMVVQRPDNPGYLEGAAVGLDAWVARHTMPKWIAISNTDLEFMTAGLMASLEGAAQGSAVIVAPRVTEGEAAVEKNPHVLVPRTRRRHLANAVITATPRLAYGYVWLSSRRRARVRSGSPAVAAPQAFYSPYGALVFYSESAVRVAPLPRNVPLLAEEYFIAESARKAGIPVLFSPDVHVHHSAHTTTGPAVSLRRATQLSLAFRAIAADARRSSA